MSLTPDTAKLGMTRLGRFILGGYRYAPAVYDRAPMFHVEIRSAGGGSILYYMPKNLLDGMYEDKASQSGRLDLSFAPQDKVWDYIQYGREVWLYKKGQLQKIYVIRGIRKSRR
jgi:hypothetical protein